MVVPADLHYQRAEIRDRSSRRILRGLRMDQRGRKLAHRPPVSSLISQRYANMHTSASEPPLPTIPHFLRLLSNDPHVSFVMSLAREKESANRIRAAVSTAAGQLYKLSLEYHQQRNRQQVHRSKATVALSMLDDLVAVQPSPVDHPAVKA